MSLKSTTAQIGKTAEHVMRPARYLGAGVKGTAWGMLDGMAHFGRKGFWAGLGVGMLVGIATGGMGYVVGLAIGGLLVGAGAGAAVGALKGGYSGVTREARRDKYADEVVERNDARTAREARTQTAVPHYRDVQASRRNISNYNFERQLQQERENDRDYNTYWQDRVSTQGNGNGRGY